MENFARVVFTIVFITILAGVIVAFGLFAIAPAEKVIKVITGNTESEASDSTLSEALTKVISDVVSRALPTSTTEGNQPYREETGGGGTYSPPPVPEPGSPENPQQSSPIAESEVPATAMKLFMSAAGFEPSGFAVVRGGVIALSVTSRDDQTHVFKFADPALADVAVGVGPGETRLIEFYAPEEAGEYGFYCDVPGHRARGEEGVMVVE
jgi:plastocyanin